MKKGKVFGKKHVMLALMLLALGGAVWLNMRFSSTEKYLGEAKYVSDDISDSGEAIQTGAKVEQQEEDYFKSARNDRQKALTEAQELTEETLKSADISDAEREKALESTNAFAQRIEKANNIETVLKAKGFQEVVVIIGESDVNVIVKSDGITTTQTLQIQDVVTSQTDIALSNIKIVSVK